MLPALPLQYLQLRLTNHSPEPTYPQTVFLGPKPNWPLLLTHTCLAQATIHILLKFHADAAKVGTNIKHNNDHPVRCVRSFKRALHLCKWSDEGGKCDQCKKDGGQCLYYVDKKRIKVMD